MSDALTHATTIPQPLAWACAAGYCPIIPTDTRPPLEREGELLGIHAGLKEPTDSDFAAVARALGPLTLPPGERWGLKARDFPRGALIGVARLVGVVRRSPVMASEFGLIHGRADIRTPLDLTLCARIRPWWPPGTKWGLLLDETVLLQEPIPMRGSGGVWRLPMDPEYHALTNLHMSMGEWALEQWRKARAR